MTAGIPDVSTRVSLVVIATGLYDRFLPELVASARQHVRGLSRVFVLSDHRPADDELVVWLPWGHVPWPYPTLLRFRALDAYADELSATDVLVYVDVDMLFTGEVDLRDVSGTLAVTHPGFADADPAAFPYERRDFSRAFVSPGDGFGYYAGGVQGGRADAYLAACHEMALMAQGDLDDGIVPVWHDESLWNRWCVDHPPDVVLGTEYCTPEPVRHPGTRIVALDKDHDTLRQVTRSARIRRTAVSLRRRVRGRLFELVKKVLRR